MSNKETVLQLEYHLLWILDQYCSSNVEGTTLESRYNADAYAVDYLFRRGLIEITEGEWPWTKRLKFRISDKGKSIMESCQNACKEKIKKEK